MWQSKFENVVANFAFQIFNKASYAPYSKRKYLHVDQFLFLSHEILD